MKQMRKRFWAFFMMLCLLLGLIPAVSVDAQAATGSVLTSKIYVPVYSSNFLNVYDMATQQITKTITVGNTPNSSAYSANGNVYVTNRNDHTVSVISTETDTVINTISLSYAVYGAIADAAGKYLFVGCVGGFDIIDLKNNNAQTFVNCGGDVYTLVISGSKVYAPINNSGNMYIYDLSSKSGTSMTVEGASNLYACSLSPDGKTIAFTDTTANTIFLYDIAANTMTPILKNTPNDYCEFSPDGSALYFVSRGSRVLNKYVFSSKTLLSLDLQYSGNYSMGLSADGSTAYVVSYGGKCLCVVNLSSFTLTKTVAMNGSPYIAGGFMMPISLVSEMSKPAVTVGTQTGALTYGMTSQNATFAVTNSNFTNTLTTGQYSTAWFSNAAGTTATTAPSGVTLTATNTAELTATIDSTANAGTYYFKLTATDSAKNETATSEVTALTIGKAAGEASVAMNGWTYGSTASEPVPVSATNGTTGVTYSYTGRNGTSYSASATRPSALGDYTVTATFPQSANHQSVTAAANFTIAQATPAITIAANQNKVYNGAAITAGTNGAALLYAYNGDGVVDVKWYADNNGAKGNEIAAPTNAGTYWIGVSAAAGANYTAAAETAQKFTITAATATVTVDDIAAQGYTGAQISVTPVVRVNGNVILTSDYTVEQGTNIAAGTDAGSVTVKAAAGGNFAFMDVTKHFTVTPAPLTVTANAQSKTYGEADPALTYTASGWKGTDGASLFTGTLTRNAGEAVGDYAVTLGTLSAGNNYTVSYTGANLTVNKAAVTLNVAVDPASAKPGKTVTVTVNAVNSAAPALAAGASQPTGVTLQAPDGSSIALIPVNGQVGVYTGSYTILKDAAANSLLTFTAAVTDSTGNYTNPPDQTAVLTVTEMGAVRLTLTADKTAGVIYGDSVTYTAKLEKENPVLDLLNKIDGTVKFYLGDPAVGELLSTKTIGADTLTVTLAAEKLTKGDHVITAVYSGNAEYGAAQQSVSTSVAAKALGWDAAGLTSIKEFDGKLDAPFTGELKLSGIVGSDDIGFTYNKTATTAAYADANAGTNKMAEVTVANAQITNSNYTLPMEKPAFTGTVTAVKEISAPAEPEPHGYQLKLEMDTGIDSVPAEIAAADPTLSTPKAIENKLKLDIDSALGTDSDVKVNQFDLTLWISKDSSITWEKATVDNFPTGGITVTIPWSELGLTYEQAQHTNFSVTHMFASSVNGHTPGTTESPAWTAAADGLCFTVAGLSPIAVGYETLPLVTFDANGGSTDTVGDYTEQNGNLASLPTPTRSGYTFGGWYTAASGGDKVTADTVFSGNATVYAHWTQNAAAKPETGDASQMPLLTGLMAASLLGLTVALVLRRKEQEA